MAYRSRFEGRIVDAHCHVDAPAREHFPRLAAGAKLAGFLNLWDANWPPPAYEPWRESMAPFTPQMQLCHMPDLSDVGADGFEQRLVGGIRDAAAAGAAGLKVWKNLGLWLEDVDGQRLTLTDERLAPLWATAAEVELPIVIHVGDPPEFFAPLDASNRRREELEQHPDWWFGRGGFPTLEQLLGQFEQVVAVHPQTVFVAAHFGCFLEPPEVARMLDRYPNYNVDTSVRLLNLADTPARARACRDIVLAHPDRVIFGTDFLRTDFWDLPSAGVYGGDRGNLDAFYEAHWRFFETADEVEIPYPFAMEGEALHGLHLPDDVLERVYAGNARRIYRGRWRRGDGMTREDDMSAMRAAAGADDGSREQHALLAGAASATTTPPLSVSLDGQFRDRRPTEVLSELAARALVLDGGDGPVALLTIDACRLELPFADELIATVAQTAGIAPERIILTATHIHAGPVLCETPWYGPDRAYLDELAASAAAAVAQAREQLRPARVLAGQGAAPALMFNRRYRMRDGSARSNPGIGNPDVVAPLGPVDPAVDVLRVEGLDGRPIAHLVTYALHVAVVTEGLSGDFPEVLSRRLQARDGVEAPVLFAMGCAGDVNHVDVHLPEPQTGQACAERIGAALAEKVTDALAQAAALPAQAPLRYASATVALALHEPETRALDDDEAAAALAVGGADPNANASATGGATEAIKGYRDWALRRIDGTETQVVVQALALGPVVYVALPGEIFAALGLDLKRRSPFRQTLVGTLNATARTYIGTRAAYDEGGYEVLSSLVEPGSGEQLIDAAVALLEQLHDEAHASHAAAAPA